MTVVGPSEVRHVADGIAFVLRVHVLGKVLDPCQCVTKMHLVGVE